MSKFDSNIVTSYFYSVTEQGGTYGPRTSFLSKDPRLRNDLLCVEWEVKPYTLTHSLTLKRHDTVSSDTHPGP